MKRPTTTSEDNSFADEFRKYANIDTGFIITWVEENFMPDEVYEKDDLINWVRENFSPEEIFDTDVLEKWAENADYVRPLDDYPEREL